MDFLTQHWSAILLSALAAWVWSFLSWAVLNIHCNDFVGLPDEDGFTAAMRSLNIAPGVYGFPHPRDHKEGRSPEFMAKWKAGPLGLLHVWSPKFNMPRNMLLTLLVYVVASCLAAYVGHLALPRGSGFAKVFQLLGTVGVLAYSFAFLPNMIWFQGRPRTAILNVADGVVQGLATGAVFAAMWPK